MGKRKVKSMFDPYEKKIIALLDAGKSMKQIYREDIYPAMHGGCGYEALVYFVNARGLRSVAANDGYEVVPKCAECSECKLLKRHRASTPDMKICLSALHEINEYVISSPRWCPKRDRKRQGEI